MKEGAEFGTLFQLLSAAVRLLDRYLHFWPFLTVAVHLLDPKAHLVHCYSTFEAPVSGVAGGDEAVAAALEGPAAGGFVPGGEGFERYEQLYGAAFAGL